nr:16S rRNA (guanine(527)-N(7))-methyltransferase RsmG [Pseudomonas sp.]
MTQLTDRPALSQRLARDAKSIGLSLNADQIEALVEYLAQMLRWNRTYNLTAIRDPEAMRVQHLVDSLSVIPVLAQRIQNDAAGKDNAHANANANATNDATTGVGASQTARIMDVGSGGGLPGVVLAIAQPGWQVHCVDAVEKKTAFVRQMAGVLRLANLSASHARVETIEPAQCDIVISRAFASIEDFAALAGRHVRVGGTLAAMKGRQPDEEIAAVLASGAWRLDAIHPLQVPGLDAQRCIAFLAHT